MIKKQPFIVLILLFVGYFGCGQLNIGTLGTNYTINFDATVTGVNNGTFAGAGFQPAPTVGQLDSDAWAVTGWSDGNLAFGGTNTSGDHARGQATGAVTTGGFYSYQGTNRMLMIQPGTSDWAPGTLTLRIQNNTGFTITNFNVAYDLHVRNDQARSNSFNFSYSTDDVTYTPVVALNYTSTAVADASGMVSQGTKSTTISSLSIANGAYFYVRWSGADVGGSGSRDEFALDNIVISGLGSTDEVDYCNLQSPATGNITLGSVYNVYAQAYEPGVTNNAGQGAGISAWIGYSTSNTNPNTWTNWVVATYNLDSGNNDEYVANIGSVIPTSGTYYYASRFQYNGGPYKYGGITPPSGGGFWNGTTNVNGVLSVDTVDFCNLQFPGIGTITLGSAFAVYGQVYEPGLTPGAGQGAGVTAWIGYSTTNTNPNTWTNWIPATYNAGCTDTCNSLQNDEYSADLGVAITAPGTYYYATRFTLNSGIYTYGGILSDGSAGYFWDGTTYLSGVLTVNAPEIDVERNTNASIPSGSAASTGFNTVFATTTIGSSTAPKTYYVHNEGTSNLNVSSITSSNPTEFSISTNPAPVVLAPGALALFEITFSPTSNSPTSRTATITVVSDDSDESNYTFNVQGNANCPGASLTITPQSGPVGTIVTVTGTDFGGATTALVNGISATVNVISSTVIEVTVPSNATTGSIEVTNQINCKSTALFTVIDDYITSCEGSGTPPMDLFISEITDKGTGSHTYIEIFNGTGSAVDMTAGNYQVRIHNNGNATATKSINLTGTIANNSVKVLAIGGTNYMDPEGGYTADFFDNTGGINDDDNVRLYKNGTWIDLWGDTTGTAFTIASKDYTYRRKNTGITAPSTTWNANDWEAFTPVNYTDIGTYDFSVGTPPSISTQPVASASTCDLTATLSVVAIEGYNGGGDTKDLAYQWYFSAPGNTGWTAVPNTSPYSGETTNALNISNTIGLNGYQYYCQVREDSSTCYKASNAVRLDVDTTTWNGSTWSNGVPAIGTIATLNGDYTTNSTNGSFSACNLIVNNGYTLNILDNYYVEVENNLTVNGNVSVQPKGAFVQNNDSGSVDGAVLSDKTKIVVNKKTASPSYAWYEYTYWSSPVVGETIADGLFESSGSRRFLFNAQNFLDACAETNNNNTCVPGSQDGIDDNGDDWQWVSGGTIMQPGVGYASTHDSTIFSITFGCPGPTCSIEYTFEGPFNNGEIKVPVYRNDSELNDVNSNFIGNPYASAIDADEFFDLNAYDVSLNPSGTLEGVIYLWSHNTMPSATANGNQNLNFSDLDYAIINAGTGETAGGDGVIPNRFVPSGQGFFVNYSNSGAIVASNGNVKTGEVVFNNAMRVKGASDNSQFFRTTNPRSSKSKGNANKLWINLTSDIGVTNQVLVGYVGGATNGNDGLYYDVPRAFKPKTALALYSLSQDDESKYAIQGKDPESLNLEEVIPLGFYSAITGATLYKFSIAQFKGDFFNTNTVYLKDKLMNVVHDLSQSDYSFTSAVGEFKDRFEIVFKSETLSDIQFQQNTKRLSIIELEDGRVQFKTNNSLTIQSVKIIDLLGRTLYELKGSNASEIYDISNLSQAAYIAKVELSNGQIITKRAVKRM